MGNLRPTQRKIIHVDMDAFFASVEQRDFPEYRGQPLIVGGRPNSRGVVAACSYEARKFGIHSAMPCAQALKRCPDAIFVPPRFEVYRQVSQAIHKIFWRYASQMEPLSLDEAYLDVTYTAACNGSATLMAKSIKRDIVEATGLIASAGVSYNKFLAKIASDMDKPDGLYVITPEQGAAFVARLAIGKFYGVGPVTEKKMRALGIASGQDLLAWSLEDLKQHFGKQALYYYNIARGMDERPVRSFRERQSLGKEITLAADVCDVEILMGHIHSLAEKVLAQIQQKNIKPKTITLKIKYANFKQITRSWSGDGVCEDLSGMQARLRELLKRTDAGREPVRLVGVSCSGFVGKAGQGNPEPEVLNALADQPFMLEQQRAA